MANPNPSPKTRIRSGIDAETKGRKGGKASGESRRAFATFKECFKHEMTDEQMKLAYKKLWELFLKDGKIEAFDRLKDIMDGGESTANNINITFASQEMEEYGD